MRYFFAACFIFLNSGSAFAVELNFLYKKNCIPPQSQKEIELVSHAKTSYVKALKLESKLTGVKFAKDGYKRDPKNPDYRSLKNLDYKPYYHLLNNLCELKGVTHLHVGLLAGDSFVAALYKNQSNLKKQIGLDWFQECPENIFLSNCKKHLNLNKCLILNCECFKVDKSIFDLPIDIFLYDADHSLIAHEKAFTYYNDIFADIFIAVVDDWECPWIRKPTFKAFDKLGYQILYEAHIPGPSPYRSGQYIAVIKK
ncbi:MAG: hypothetical protein K1000chlam3_00882 [Chlamydiae bacterium]|nr:hypothetical protein [Chlamydiota bacterium]